VESNHWAFRTPPVFEAGVPPLGLRFPFFEECVRIERYGLAAPPVFKSGLPPWLAHSNRGKWRIRTTDSCEPQPASNRRPRLAGSLSNSRGSRDRTGVYRHPKAARATTLYPDGGSPENRTLRTFRSLAYQASGFYQLRSRPGRRERNRTSIPGESHAGALPLSYAPICTGDRIRTCIGRLVGPPLGH
jgi:hypothetical protein